MPARARLGAGWQLGRCSTWIAPTSRLCGRQAARLARGPDERGVALRPWLVARTRTARHPRALAVRGDDRLAQRVALAEASRLLEAWRPRMQPACWTKDVSRSRRSDASRENARSTCCAGGCAMRACGRRRPRALPPPCPRFLRARRDAATAYVGTAGNCDAIAVGSTRCRRFRRGGRSAGGWRGVPRSGRDSVDSDWSQADAGGLPCRAKNCDPVRAGGESLRPHPGRPRKRLKDLCQEAGDRAVDA